MSRTKKEDLIERLERMLADQAWPRFYANKAEVRIMLSALKSNSQADVSRAADLKHIDNAIVELQQLRKELA